MSLAITDEFCECGMPSELVSLEFFCAPDAHLSYAHYRCVNGHEWEDEREAEVVDE